MSASYSVKCDGCGIGYSWHRSEGRAISIQGARAELRRDAGWHAVRRPDGRGGTVVRDLCDRCFQAGAR